MEKISRWIATHRVSVYIISFVLLIVWNIIKSSLGEIGIGSLIIFFAILLPDVCMNKFVNRAVAKLNNECDPYPLLEESEYFLARKNKKAWEFTNLCNKYCAMRDMGKYQEVYEGLQEIAAKKYRSVSPAAMYVLYHNLGDICLILEKNEEAAEWNAKMQETFMKIKPRKLKEQFESMRPLEDAMHLYHDGAYQEALKVLGQFAPNCLRSEVSFHKVASLIFSELDDIEHARFHLEAIVEKGNRLYAVEEAKALLAEMPTCEYI